MSLVASTHQQARLTHSKLNALTSLRLVAAVVVVIFHSRGFLLPVSLYAPGGDAVNFFFVLSGFILTYTYCRKPINLKRFYLARFARIIPASLLSILAYLLLINSQAIGTDPLRLSMTASNVLFPQSMIPVPFYYFALNAVLWSVSVEVFFYIFFPALQQLLKQKRYQLLLVMMSITIGLLMVSISTFFRLPDYSPSTFARLTWHGLVYISPLSRLKEFALGMTTGKLFMSIDFGFLNSRLGAAILTLIETGMLGGLIFVLPTLTWYSNLIASHASPMPAILSAYINQLFVAVFFCCVHFHLRNTRRPALALLGK